jgi:DNA-binding YbaB/EbfC family protein
VSEPKLDLSEVMRQAQQVGARLERVREELRHRTVSATVGGGSVTATANGALELVSLVIEPYAVDPRDVEMLQSLIVSAVNEALRRAQELAREELARATGLPLGGSLPGTGA